MPSWREATSPAAWSSGSSRAPLLILSVAGVVVVAIIGAMMVVYLRNAGLDHEQREAEEKTRLSGRVVVEPLITPTLLRGDAAAIARLDQAVRTHVLRAGVVRIKLWTPDGRIAYSDEPRLIGMQFAVEPDERDVLRTGRAISDLSDLDRPENRFERGEGQLLQVYTRVHATDGRPMLFEAYQRFESIAANGTRLWQAVLLPLLAGLLLLELVNIALARWFALHIQGRERERGALVARALNASNSERRRIAAELHDGVVQDLTAASLTVSNVARALDDDDPVDARTRNSLEGASDSMRGSVNSLRTLLLDFYPADLEARGLAAALGDLVALARTRGLVADLHLDPELDGPVAIEGLLFRVAQEGLRNASAHSLAGRVWVRAGMDDDRYWVEVRDDGTGFDTSGPAPEGHFGLRALRDLLADAGGRLSVHSRPGEGSLVRGEIPKH